jgi:hypothetical protein
VLAGETTMEEVVAPVFQEYVPPPEPVNVVLAPLQRAIAPEEITGMGLELTVTTCVVDALHPAAFVTVRV